MSGIDLVFFIVLISAWSILGFAAAYFIKQPEAFKD